MKDILQDALNTLKDFDEDWDTLDAEPITENEYAFEHDMFNLLQDLIGNSLNEQFTSFDSLKDHFDNHCIGKNTQRKSRASKVYYDFITVNKYKAYEDKISKYIQETPFIIPSLLDIELIKKYFRKLFEGNVSIRFQSSCGLENNLGSVILGIHSFATNVTENYSIGNTVDICVMTPKYKTITLYAVDAHYLQTKINNILKKYSNFNSNIVYNND